MYSSCYSGENPVFSALASSQNSYLQSDGICQLIFCPALKLRARGSRHPATFLIQLPSCTPISR